MTWNSTISCLNPLLLIRNGHITPVSAKDHETNCKKQNITSWREKSMLYYLVHLSPNLNKRRTTNTPPNNKKPVLRNATIHRKLEKPLAAHSTLKKPLLRNVRIYSKLEKTLAAQSTQYTHQEQHYQERPI